MRFTKYHGLGNDYIVVPPEDAGQDLAAELVRWICDRHYGVGSDGALLGPLPSQSCDFRLRLYNPDGGEFEKSGNGIRIFARYLYDRGFVHIQPFTLETLGGRVTCQVEEGGQMVTVEMGVVRFDSQAIPVQGPKREVINESFTIDGKQFRFCAATLGNPHCVVLCDEISSEAACRYGPLIENYHLFPNRTNVQFMKVLDRENIQIEIWERGAGYTLASGSSSCAAAAVAHRLNLCGSEISVHVPGGVLGVRLEKDFSATLKGPVTRICEGTAFEQENQH